MISVIRHIVFFILQFAGATLAAVGLCAGVTLHTYGLQYRFTPEFAGKLDTYFKFGLVVACLFCLVLFCYHLTSRSLDAPRNEPWNNTDNPDNLG